MVEKKTGYTLVGLLVLVVLGGVLGVYKFPFTCADTCYDSDGNDITTKGYAVYEERPDDKLWDWCYSSTEVIEYTCNFWGYVQGDLHECAGGCYDGRCVVENECYDSDGDDYYTKGYVTFNDQKYWDYCDDSTHVFELYCGSNNEKKEELVHCIGGCSNGACQDAVTTTTISDDPQGEVTILYLGVVLICGGGLLYLFLKP